MNPPLTYQKPELIEKCYKEYVQYDPNTCILNCGHYWTLVNMKASYCLLRYDAVWSGRASPEFCRNELCPSSWYSQDESTSFLQNIMLCQTTQDDIPEEFILWSICLVSIMKPLFNVSLWSRGFEHQTEENLKWWKCNSNCWFAVIEIKC
jgi:hypothetical protein